MIIDAPVIAGAEEVRTPVNDFLRKIAVRIANKTRFECIGISRVSEPFVLVLDSLNGAPPSGENMETVLTGTNWETLQIGENVELFGVCIPVVDNYVTKLQTLVRRIQAAEFRNYPQPRNADVRTRIAVFLAPPRKNAANSWKNQNDYIQREHIAPRFFLNNLGYVFQKIWDGDRCYDNRLDNQGVLSADGLAQYLFNLRDFINGHLHAPVFRIAEPTTGNDIFT